MPSDEKQSVSSSSSSDNSAARRGVSEERRPSATEPTNTAIHNPDEERRQPDNVSLDAENVPMSSSSSSEAETESDKEPNDMLAPPTHMHGFTTMIFFNVFYFIAFVFVLTSSTSIPWLAAGNGRKWSLWREWGAGLPSKRVTQIHDCSNEQDYWQIMAACTCMCVFSTLATFISSMLLTFGKGHIGVTLVLGMYSNFLSIIAWAICVTQYHFFRCGKGVFVNHINRLNAGFALMFIAWALMFVGEFILLIHFFNVYEINRNAPASHPMRFGYVFLSSVVLLLVIVGSAFTLWEKDFPVTANSPNPLRVKVTLWHTEVIDLTTGISTWYGRQHYGCTTWTRRGKVGAAFMAMSIVFLFFNLLVAIAAVYRSRVYSQTNILAFISVIFLFVYWVLLVATRHKPLCTTEIPAGTITWFDSSFNGLPSGVWNARIDWKGYTITEGLGMIIAAWCIMFVAYIGNMFTPPGNVKRAYIRKRIRAEKKKEANKQKKEDEEEGNALPE